MENQEKTLEVIEISHIFKYGDIILTIEKTKTNCNYSLHKNEVLILSLNVKSEDILDIIDVLKLAYDKSKEISL